MTGTLGLELTRSACIAAAVDETGHVVGRGRAAIGEAGMVAAARAAVESAARAAGGGTMPAIGVAAIDPTSAGVAELLKAFGHAPRTRAVGTGTAAAVAEAWCGVARQARHVVCLVAGDHVSAGVLVDGRPWTGAHDLAGSAAWLALNPVERQDYRQVGCLEAEVSERGIARRLVWRVEAGDESAAVARAGRLDAVTAHHVFDAARQGDGVAISVVRDTARYVGMAVSNLVALFDPDIVVLGGFVAEAPDLLLDPIRLESQRHLSPALADCLRIEVWALGADAPAVGAARLAATVAP